MYTNSQGNFKPQSPTRSIPLFVPGHSHPVAFLNGDTLTKGILPAHYLTRPAGAIAFDESVLAEARRRGATQIRVTDRQSGAVYRASFDDFDRYRFLVPRGFGRQWALERGRWSIDGATPELQAREEAQAAKNSQLSLFTLEGAG